MNFMCDSPVIKAISFVGSNAAGEHVYERGTRQGKRVQVPITCLATTSPCIAVAH